MCKGPVVGISLVRLNPEGSKFQVSGGRGYCGLQGADRGLSLWLLWGLGLHSKTSEAMKSLKKDVTGSDLGF